MTRTGYIYVLSIPELPGFIKIGRAKDLYARLKKLQTSLPVTYKIEHYQLVNNMFTMETALHNYYRNILMLNANGMMEWYKTKYFGSKKRFVEDVKNRMKFLLREDGWEEVIGKLY